MANAASEAKKKRVNLTLDEQAWQTAERLAQADNRSVSNLLETLILRADSPTTAHAAARLPRSARLASGNKRSNRSTK